MRKIILIILLLFSLVSFSQRQPPQNGMSTYTYSNLKLTKAQKIRIKDSLYVCTYKLEHEGYDPIILAKRAELNFFLKRYSKAVNDYSVLINNNANNLGEWYYRRGLNKMLKNKNLEISACEDFKKAEEFRYVTNYKNYPFCK